MFPANQPQMFQAKSQQQMVPTQPMLQRAADQAYGQEYDAERIGFCFIFFYLLCCFRCFCVVFQI